MGANVNYNNLFLTNKGVVNSTLLKKTGVVLTIREKKFEKPLTVQEVIKEFFKTLEDEGKVTFVCEELKNLNLDETYNGTEEFSVAIYENILNLSMSEIDQEKSKLRIKKKLNLLQAGLVLEGLVDEIKKEEGMLKNLNTIVIDCTEKIKKINIKIYLQIYSKNHYHVYMYSSPKEHDIFTNNTGFVSEA